MAKKYRPWTQDQTYLLPPSLRDWLPEDHLAWCVLDVVSALNLSSIERTIQGKDARGERPYDPEMMVALLIYGYCTGVFSSRKLERACHEMVPFRVIAANTQPHFTTINEFRRVHREHFADLFVQVLRLCREAGLVKLGHVAVDGTKVHANASKHKAMSYERMSEDEARLHSEVEALLAQADAADTAEDAVHGAHGNEIDVPEELQRRKQRLQRISQAKAALEAGARLQRSRDLRTQADGMENTAKNHPDSATANRLFARARQRREEADRLDPPDDEGGGAAGVDGGDEQSLERKTTPTTTQGEPQPRAQYNFTDPDSSIMVGRDGFIQAYNCQLAVDEHAQVIVAAGVTNQPPDAHLLLPMLERTRSNLDTVPTYVTADTGYWTPQAPERAKEMGTEALIAVRRTSHREASQSAIEDIAQPDSTAPPESDTSPDPAEPDPRDQMRDRLQSAEGRAVYTRRKTVVEPVNGHIKECQGFRRFSFRGLEAVEAEWNLVSLCHNIRKLMRYHWVGGATAQAS